MNNLESAVIFQCQGEDLLGILHFPEKSQHAKKTGFLIVVGGPQYRVGSHRQFTLLARFMANHGVPVFRFDYRAMGDSGGDAIDFESVDDDIRAAIDVFMEKIPQIEKVVIWGLCDAASAASFYGFSDDRVAGLVLLNPWVRTEAGMAKAYIKHYYLQRLLSKEFWAKLIAGGVNLRESLSSFVGLLNKGRGADSAQVADSAKFRAMPLPERMVEGLHRFTKPVLFILSGNNDFVADEFRDLVRSSDSWRRVMSRGNVKRIEFPEANHTFSKSDWRHQVELWTLEWVEQSCL